MERVYSLLTYERVDDIEWVMTIVSKLFTLRPMHESLKPLVEALLSSYYTDVTSFRFIVIYHDSVSLWLGLGRLAG
jgi:hypothetical protein